MPEIENNVQDRNSKAWQMLCEYIDEIAESGSDEFVPREALGNELFAEIHTLPKSISKLKNVTKIGLKDSRISTRALLGNFKNRMLFPSLEDNPIRYFGETVKCSICKKEMSYEETNQLWITLRTGTDTIPLLANLCSKECEEELPQPPENYVQQAHKGGMNLVQPLNQHELWEKRRAEQKREEGDDQTLGKNRSVETNKPRKKVDWTDLKPLKLIRKIWEK